MKNDTIAAISTALGGAISIVRLSGSEAIKITSEVFIGCDITKASTHTVHYGYIKDSEVIDQVLVSIFKAPKTYTKEDVVEVNCHGGAYVTTRVLEAIINHGARLAEAGEFTKRAFLNGRIDLTQAEAVMDMISASSKESLKIANRGLSGDILSMIQDLRGYIINVLAKIEVNIDYPEYEDEEQITNEVIIPIITKVKAEVDAIVEESKKVIKLKSGIKTALIGKPNVGKSSLLNALIREDKAIVTNIAGTTRDIVEGSVNLNGLQLNLIDTAGLHTTSDVVEAIGIEKTKKVLNEADLVLLIFDNSTPFTADDLDLLKITKDKNRIIIVNKSDLPSQCDFSLLDDYMLLTSFNKADILSLEAKIKEVLSFTPVDDSTKYLANVRQLTKLEAATKSLNEALNAAKSNYPIDLISIDLNNAWTSLGEIIGLVNKDDLIDELFGKFCLGK